MKSYKIYPFLVAVIFFSCGSGSNSDSGSGGVNPSENSAATSWARSVVSSDFATAINSIAVDSNGNIYAVGAIVGESGTLNLGNSIAISGSNNEFDNAGDGAFITKYNSTGTVQWIKSVQAKATFSKITLDSSGNIYVVGKIGYHSNLDLGNGVTVTGGEYYANALIVKYSSNGTTQWARSFSTGSYSFFSDISLDTSGNVYVVGTLAGEGIFDFGNNVTVTGDNGDLFAVLVKYNSAGVAQWIKAVDTESRNLHLTSIALDATNNIYVTGYFEETDTFDLGDGVTFVGAYEKGNALLIKYNSSGTPQWATSPTASNGISAFNDVVLDQSGSIYAVGSVSGTNATSFGSSVQVTAPSNGEDSLIVKFDPSGTAQWAKSMTAESSSPCHTVAADSSGNVYVAAYTICSNCDFGNGIEFSASYSYGKGHIIKYNSSGATQWVKTIVSTTGTSNTGSSLSEIVIDASNNIYAAGYILNDADYYIDPDTDITVTGAYEDENLVLIKHPAE